MRNIHAKKEWLLTQVELLSKSEKKYDDNKLEFPALKWAVTKCFYEYLYEGVIQSLYRY